MTEKIFSLVAGLAVIFVLTACGSTLGLNNSAPGGDGAGSDAGSSPPESYEITPDLTDVVIPEGSSMRVLWTISRYVIGKNSSMTETSAQVYLFKSLDINDTEIIFDNQLCQGVTFQQNMVKATDYLADTWQTTPTELGIDTPELQVFKTNCSLPGFQEYMRLGDGQLIVPIQGVFFFFAPAVAY